MPTKPNTDGAAPMQAAESHAKHTPWGWYHVGCIPGDGCLRLDAANGTNILITDETKEAFGYNPLPNEANSALLAAAPELLHALRAMLRWTGALPPSQSRDLPDYTEEEATALARAAIARAEGRA